MVSIVSALAQVKANLAEQLQPDRIRQQAKLMDHRWRRGPLDPAATVFLFITQVLNGNTAIMHLRHLAAMTCSASAYCQARMRLPLALIETLSQSISDSMAHATADVSLWLGHRIWHVDGSSFSMPDEPALQHHFGQPGGQAKGCGFPVATLLVLVDATTGFIARTLALPLRTHEQSQVSQLHDALKPGDVLVGDRGFCSFVHLALLMQGNRHAVLRAHQRTIVCFKRGRAHRHKNRKACHTGLPTSKWLRWLGPTDQLVQWHKPVDQPAWCDDETYTQLPMCITLRELRYKVNRKGFRTKTVTLVTTLLDADKYSKQALADLYRDRWHIEKRLHELKITMKMDQLHCHTVSGVLKELAVFTLVYNMVRRVCLESALQQGVSPDRVSFVDALRWLITPQSQMPLNQLAINPTRPNRAHPRVQKRRPKQYPLMQKPRHELMQALMGNTVGG